MAWADEVRATDTPAVRLALEYRDRVLTWVSEHAPDHLIVAQMFDQLVLDIKCVVVEILRHEPSPPDDR